jgi:hypothetical protein
MIIIRKKKKTSCQEEIPDVNTNNIYHNFKIESRPDLPPENERNDYYSNGMKRVRKLLNLLNRWP